MKKILPRRARIPWLFFLLPVSLGSALLWGLWVGGDAVAPGLIAIGNRHTAVEAALDLSGTRLSLWRYTSDLRSTRQAPFFRMHGYAWGVETVVPVGLQRTGFELLRVDFGISGVPVVVERRILLPYWFVSLVSSLLFLRGFVAWRRLRRQARWDATGRCRDCGYDLRANTRRCPECGRAIPITSQTVDHSRGKEPHSA
jgi:hypothetical protein